MACVRSWLGSVPPYLRSRAGGRSGRAGVVQFDVIERDQFVLDERQGREPAYDQNLHDVPFVAEPTSVRMLGRTRSSQRGNHQFDRPVSCRTAGVATMRTSVASSRTAIAMPSPMTRSTRRSPRTNAAKTQIMMAAAEVMIRPVLARASATASESAVAEPAGPARHSSRILETRKTW